MTINYTEKGIGLHDAIQRAGYWLTEGPNGWESSNDVAVQGIIDGYDAIGAVRAARIGAIKADGLARINSAFPAIVSIDEVAFYAEFWLSIAPAARLPTAPFKRVIDIYSAAKTAIASVNAATTQAAINAVAPNWPV